MFFKEFKTFIMRGNVIDVAVGIIIGAAFGKVVSSLVSDIIMPPIGLLLGKIDFSNLSLVLHQQTVNSTEVAIRYGLFINTLLNFVIVGFAIFIIVKQMNKLKELTQKPSDPLTKECPYCNSSISVKASRCPACTSQL